MYPQSFCAQALRLSAAAIGVPEADALSRSRVRRAVRARQIAIYLGIKVRGLSYPTVGRQFGRDHTTAISAVKRVETLAARDPAFAQQLNALVEEAHIVRKTQAERALHARVVEASQLPPRITTDHVCDLAGYSPGTLASRIKEGRMPKPVDKARQHIFERDAVLKALGLAREGASTEAASW
jgi:Bacterial dnaA protein helix-turn-helix